MSISLKSLNALIITQLNTLNKIHKPPKSQTRIQNKQTQGSRMTMGTIQPVQLTKMSISRCDDYIIKIEDYDSLKIEKSKQIIEKPETAVKEKQVERLRLRNVRLKSIQDDLENKLRQQKEILKELEEYVGRVFVQRNNE